MALTRMIFAIQMTDPKPTRLRVSGDVGTPTSTMTSLRREDSKLSSVGWVNGSWTMDVGAGDYLIAIQVENWVPGRLDIVTELAPGQSPPTFVYDAPPQRSPLRGGLAAWNAPAFTINDTKDPWPPPPPPTAPPVTLALESSEWFTAKLAAAWTWIAAQPAGKSPPASVLDALVTGL
jgi:hypothetical protein